MDDRTAQARKDLQAARLQLSVSQIWKHYKGGVYEVQGVAIDTVDSSVRVTYRRIDGPGFDALMEESILYSRPFSEWQQTIAVQQGDGSIPDDYEPRFQPVSLAKTYVPIH